MRVPLAVCGVVFATGLALAATARGAPLRDLEEGPFDRQQAEKAAAEFADEIEASYLYPDLGASYANLLRKNLRAGRYSRFSTDRAFTRLVETDLAAIKPDLHLHLIAPSVPKRGVVGTAASPTGTCPSAGTQIERSMGKSGWVAPGVAYIEFCAFRDGTDDVAALRKFLDQHATARALIIDNRNNNGGGFDESNLLLSRLVDSPTLLLQLDIRRTVDEKMPFPFTDGYRWKRLPPDRAWAKYRWYAQPDKKAAAMRKAKVLVLTSKWTESAGEAIALALKASRRATVIGETTHGAGHLAPTLPLAGDYRGQIPIGRIYDPRSGVGIEGIGVAPTIKTTSDKALAKAFQLLGVKPASGLRRWSMLATVQPR